MASGWHNKLARLSHMNWEEIRTRTGQELHKRGDLLRHRLGMPPTTMRLSEPTRPAAKFFFADGEAQKRAELLSQHLPQQAAEIVRQADDICQHKFRLLGYENLDYGKGKDIDWHLDPVHGKRAPLDPWFKIPFLDFAVAGDHKVIWELNRHQHLVTLAKAWLLTKDEKYIQELMAQWHNWIKANPFPLGINWGSTLEVAFRSLSWIWVDKLLSDNDGVEPALSLPKGRTALHREAQDIAEFRAELLPALAFHGRYIERYLSTYFSPNTHLLGEAVAMFFLGTLFPQMPGAARWKEKGWKIVLHEAGRQVRPDGVYFEQSLYYHVYALDFFLYARLLAAANDERIPETFDGILLRMLNVVEALAQAGPAEGFGDDDGGRLFNPRRNRTEHMTDPLAQGFLAYNRHDLAAQLTEESIWLFGEDAVAKLSHPKTKNTAGSAAFPDGGLYILGDVAPDPLHDSQPFPQVMTIDAGPQGVGRCGHGHADALSLRLTMSGSRWLVDSGSGVYISSDPADRNAFRGTSAHNTLRVDGVDQANPNEPFSWTDVPTTLAETWVTGKTFTYFAGSHNGYERLEEPVTHRRCVLRANGSEGTGIWLVRDVALGSGEHDLEIRWHFASDVSLRQNGASELIASRPDAEPSALRLIWPDQTSWKTNVTQSLLSPAYGRYEPASVVRCETRVKLPTEIATALIAQNRTRLPAQTHAAMRMAATQNKAVQVYELQDGNERHGFLFARDKQPWSFSPWSSDAELLYYRIENEKLAHLIVIGGSSVEWQGQPLLTASRPSKFFEWQMPGGTMNGEPFPPTPLFDELKRSALSPNASSATSSYAEKH